MDQVGQNIDMNGLEQLFDGTKSADLKIEHDDSLDPSYINQEITKSRMSSKNLKESLESGIKDNVRGRALKLKEMHQFLAGHIKSAISKRQEKRQIQVLESQQQSEPSFQIDQFFVILIYHLMY